MDKLHANHSVVNKKNSNASAICKIRSKANASIRCLRRLIASSIWSEDASVRIVWITMLGVADSKGHVSGTIPGIAVLARVSVSEAKHAIGVLSSPDKYSCSTGRGGRRIAPVDGGWVILGCAKSGRTHQSRGERIAIAGLKSNERLRTK